MKLKHFIPFLATIAGLNISAENALADVIVEWQEGDNSANIQQAIDSGDSRVVIARSAEPWIIGQTLEATSPNQTILFEPGVTLKAQAGSFKDVLDSLVTIKADNVTLSGYRATLQMRKDDYADPNRYEPSPYRHLIRIRGSYNFVVEGLTLKDSGGDGIIVTHGVENGDLIPERQYSSGIIRDVVADNNHRLGISVISAKNLLIKDSILKNSSGVKPSSGLDLEPEHDWQKLVNIKVKNTTFVNNDRNGVQIGLGKYRGPLVEDVSVVFDDCVAIGNGEIGIKLQGVKSGFYDGSKGTISFNNFKVENSGWHGVWIRNDQTDPSQTYQFTFKNTQVVNSATDETGNFYPVTLWNTAAAGGLSNIDFGNDFVIQDNKDRPGVFANRLAIKDGFTNIKGIINIDNPQQQPSTIGNNLTNVNLQFTD